MGRYAAVACYALGDPSPPRSHRVVCNACGVERIVSGPTDLPLTWAASLVAGRVIHACPDCPAPPLPQRRAAWPLGQLRNSRARMSARL
jgi:hypothetical protein